MSITAPDIAQQLRRLVAAGYKAPEDVGVMSSVWRETLGEVPLPALHTAISKFLKAGSRYWPRVGEIYQLARQSLPDGYTPEGALTLAQRYRRWHLLGYRDEGPKHRDALPGPHTPCPVCDQSLRWGANGPLWSLKNPKDGGTGDARLNVYHDTQRHDSVGIGP